MNRDVVRIKGLSYEFIEVNGLKLNVGIGGEGEPIVLLHGFPETSLAWRFVAPELMKTHTVVCPDLRGYGASDKPRGDETHQSYSKRTMATDIYELMKHLGYTSFAVVGHDRGGLVGFRLALDYPNAITHLVVLDVIPTIDMWESLHGIFGVFGYHQFFLAQPANFPESMLQSAPKTFLDYTLSSWCRNPEVLSSEVRDEYLRVFSQPDTIHAMCEDYRAGAFVDGGHDATNREAGTKITAPVLVLWQDPKGMELPFSPLDIWRQWAKTAEGRPIDCGHLLPEEKPHEVTEAILRHL